MTNDKTKWRKRLDLDTILKLERLFLDDLYTYERFPTDVDTKEARQYYFPELTSGCGSPAAACEDY